MSDDNHGTDMKFLAGFFIGGLLGAATIFLIGTKEGKKYKKILTDKGQDVLDELTDQVEDLEKKGKELAKQGEVIKEQVLEKLEDKSKILR